MLELKDVQVHYGAVNALKGISLKVNRGEIVAILGANGAGKSTTLQAISGLTPLSSGSIVYDGEELASAELSKHNKTVATHKIVERGLVHCPEGRHIFPDCTVMENLEMGAYTLRSKSQVAENIEKAFHYFPRLKERAKQPGITLSGGEQQMLGVARALMSNPRLLMLDEPSLGLAPLIVAQIFEIIKQINRDGVTILLVEQNAHEAIQVSYRAYVLETGKIILSSSETDKEDLLKDERVVEAYLGM